MVAEWFYAKDGNRVGPIEASGLRQLADSGVIGPDDLVWKQGARQWVRAATVKGLFGQQATGDGFGMGASAGSAAAIPRDDGATNIPATQSPAWASSQPSDDRQVVIQRGARHFRKRRSFPALSIVATVFTITAALIAVFGLVAFFFLLSGAMAPGGEDGSGGRVMTILFAAATLIATAVFAVIYLALAEGIRLALYAASLLEDIRNQV